MSRTLISGGLVVDGTGAPARSADLLLDRSRIEAVEPPGVLAGVEEALRIDATGKVVCPGFIDLHSHGDLVLALEDPELRRRLVHGRVAQGITTEIVGNCGLGPAPIGPPGEGPLRGVLAWMTPAAADWPWTGVGSYLDHLERIGVPVNVGTLVAHGALRIAHAGLERELPSEEALPGMVRSLEESLEQGAWGMSLGLIYPPGSFTPGEEIRPLAGALGRHDALITAHVRGSSETLLDAVEELLSLGRGTGARVHHSHSEAVGPDHWRKIPRVLEMEEAARGQGVPVTYDMFPYTAAATTMAAIYPPWALEGGLPALVDRLRNEETRERMRFEIETVVPEWPPWTGHGWSHNLVLAVGWQRITVGSVATEGSRWAEGLDLVSLGDRTGRSPFDAVSDLMVREEGRVSQVIHGISGEEGREEGLLTLIREPHGAFCTDANDTGRGLPHPAAYGTYPRLLGFYARELKAISLEEAVRKMTSYPASILGLADRGLIRPGAAADLVVFDPDSVGSRATFRSPRVPADGIERVIVNGEEIVECGRVLDRTPGSVLRRGSPTGTGAGRSS